MNFVCDEDEEYKGFSYYEDFVVAAVGNHMRQEGTFLVSNHRFARERSESQGFNSFLQKGSDGRPELGPGKISAKFEFDEQEKLTFVPDGKHVLVTEIMKIK